MAESPDQVTALAKRVVSLKAIVFAALGLLGGGAACAAYMTKYATASELDAHAEASRLKHEEQDRRLAGHDLAQAVMGETLRNFEEDIHRLLDQSEMTARRVGAPIAPRTAHEKGENR